MGVNTCLWSELEHKQCPGKGCSKNINAIILLCEHWVLRAGTFGVVLYRNDLFCILLNCILAVLLDTKILCLEIIFLNSI